MRLIFYYPRLLFDSEGNGKLLTRYQLMLILVLECYSLEAFVGNGQKVVWIPAPKTNIT